MKKTTATVFIAIVSVLLAYGIGQFQLIKVFGLKSLDLQFRLYANPAVADPHIILVNVDQASLDHFEKDDIAFPWPRSLYNPMIEYLARAGARAILFDILFNNISPYGAQVDDEFAKAIRASRITSLATAFVKGGAQDKPRMDIARRFGVKFGGTAPEAIETKYALAPLPEILDSAHGIGAVIFRPDPDGVYRRVSPAVTYGGRLVPALFAIPAFEGADRIEYTGDGIQIGSFFTPLDKDGAMLVNFAGGRSAYKSYPAAEVISSAVARARGKVPSIPKEVFKDAVVIVGYTAPGLFDLKPSPISEVMPGMEIYAHALDTLLNNRGIWEMKPGPLYSIALIGALLASAGVVAISSAIGSAICAGMVMAVMYMVCHLAFGAGVWVNPVALETSVILALIGAGAWKYQTEGKQKRYIQKAFAYYVSPSVVSQLVAEPERLKLGGEKREITILFSDLEGFTTVSEKLDPQSLITLLNKYSSLMADTITDYDGTVDKYIGDAVMAFWGAPASIPGHPAKACLCALTCQQKLGLLNKLLAEMSLPPVSVRIGLNTGACVVGNMGSDKRFDYTAIGDPVNQASRLEGLNKAYGTKILAAEPTWLVACEKVFGREVDYLMVKGKDEPARVYEIMAIKGGETEAQKRIAERYTQILSVYRARQWEETMRLAELLLEDFPTDGPTAVLMERAKLYKTDPPPDDWDGSFRHTSK